MFGVALVRAGGGILIKISASSKMFSGFLFSADG
jgi:hypothetical protein